MRTTMAEVKRERQGVSILDFENINLHTAEKAKCGCYCLIFIYFTSISKNISSITEMGYNKSKDPINKGPRYYQLSVWNILVLSFFYTYKNKYVLKQK